MHNQIQHYSYDTTERVSLPRLFKAVLLTVLGVTVFSFLIVGNAAWSMTDYNANDFQNRQVYKVLPTTVGNGCKSLLKPNQTLSSKATTVNQRSAGKVAALGMILGARFALEPKEGAVANVSYDRNVPKHQKTKVGKNRSALAIAAFRKCQKEQALDKLALVN